MCHLKSFDRKFEQQMLWEGAPQDSWYRMEKHLMSHETYFPKQKNLKVGYCQAFTNLYN